MKTFTIDAENNITAHASRKEAREAGAGMSRTTLDSTRVTKPTCPLPLASQTIYLRSTLRHLQ